MNKTIHLHVKEAKGLWEKGIGLINKKPTALLLRTRFGIHTFGMRYPIDVLVLDNANRVVKLTKKMMPNKIFVWNPKFNRVIEMPTKTIEDLHIFKGDTIVYS